MSLPVQGAWIEMQLIHDVSVDNVSLPVQGAWIEIQRLWRMKLTIQRSLPVQGAWIEMRTSPRG